MALRRGFTGELSNPAGMDWPPPPAATPHASFSVGETVQVWSNTKRAWLNATVQAVFLTATVADGYSVPAGCVKVTSEVGVKWVTPEDISGLLRKLGGGSAAASSSEAVERSRAIDARSPAAPAVPGHAVLPEAAVRPPVQQRVSMTKEYSMGSSASTHMCRQGCGRPCQPGLTRNMKHYDTCCKKCAQTRGTGGHDDNCGGSRPMTPHMRGTPSSMDHFDLKSGLEGLLRDPNQLEKHVYGVFARVCEGGRPLGRSQLGEGLRGLIQPFHIKLECSEQDLSLWFTNYSSNQRDLNKTDFLNLSREVLENRYQFWFPPVLPVSTRQFVKQNQRGLEEIYKIGRKMGEGSFGKVFAVEHRVLGEQRVCKTIAKCQSGSGMTVEQILQEVEAMAMLDHPNVVKVYEYFDDRTSISQIMEPCNGGELQGKIDVFRKTGRPPYDEAFICDVIKQTLRALAFMHAMRFLHKDLKPQNIMMVDKESSSIKIIDFGLAELFNPNQEYATSIGGTLLYMAPEVIQQKMTTKADVWSVGVILYNLVTGTWPFIATWPPPSGKDQSWWTHETANIITNREMAGHPRLQQVAPHCSDLLTQTLQKDDRARPDAAQCLEHPWFSAYSEVPPTLSVGVVQCLEAYAKMPELKKAVFLLIAHQCQVQALLELRALFTHFDMNNQGSLSVGDLRRVLSASGMGPLSAERVIHALDRNDDQFVSWTEFTAAAICVSVQRNHSVVDAAFATFDMDRDGKISAEDFERVLAPVESAERWRERLPVLVDEVLNSDDGALPKPLQDTIRSVSRMLSFNSDSPVTVTLAQFRQYIGKRLDFRAGDALHAVAG